MSRQYKMKVVKIADVKVGERYRDDFGNIEELMLSIKEKGVIQPITLSKDMLLLAGERRYTACFNLKMEEIPAIIRETDGEIDEREIELMENIHRKDFTWQEQAKLTAKIHALYMEKDPNWNGRKTADLIDQNKMNVSRALRLAAGMQVIPELENCKTADEATKIIKKVEADAIVAELAKRQQNLVLTAQQPEKSAGMNVHDKGIANALKAADADYRIGDVFTGLAGLRDNGKIDFIECDPPYGVDLDILTQRDNKPEVNQRDANYHEVSEEEYPDFIDKLANETYRVAAPNSWMVFWFAFRWHSKILTALQSAGWIVDHVPALWVKGNGRTPRPDLLLARAYEPFFICRKGQPTIIQQGRTNIYLRSFNETKYHPAQRPIGLMTDILKTFLDEGHGNVLVPFVGSGVTLRACYQTGHRGFGWDTNPEYKKHFMLAVEQDTKQLLAKE